MEQYEEWQEEDGAITRKYPIHNYYNSPIPTKKNYKPSRMISSNYQKVYASPGQIFQVKKEIVNEGFNNFINSDSDPNLLSDNYDYPELSYENNQNIVYSNQYFNNNISNNINNNNSNSNITNSSLRKYESSDGVLRGYTNNYSFYVSGSSQVKPKVTINNQYNNKNSNNLNNYQNINQNQNQNKKQYIYQNITSPQKKSGQYQKIIYPNNYSNISNVNSNYGIRQKNSQIENTSYIIKMEENDPAIYSRQTQQYNNRNNMNYNNYNNYNEEEIYYFKENENRNIRQGTYQGPLVQRRMVKRVVDREPIDSRKDYYIINPRDNLRNRIKNNQYNNITNITNRNPQKPIYQKIINNPNDGNFVKFYSGNINNRIININQKKDYFAPNPFKRTNTPNAPRSNNSYSRPLISRQQRIIGNSPNYYKYKNANNSISYPDQRNRFNDNDNDYIDRTDYFITQTESNSPRNKNIYINKSPYIRNDNNIYIYPGRREREREYTSKTELQNQTEYEIEYEKPDEDDVYEVPEQFINRGFYEEKRQNFPERPFTRISNYSQSERDGRKYGVYTQTLAMNKNYNYDDEYEVDSRNIRYVRDNNNYRNNYSVPKIMKPINDVQRLLRQKREYSAFERSLKNIRDNEEEIELENEERDNKVKIKTTGSNNHRLYISDNSKGRSSRKYKTHTELQTDNRHEGYVLQEIDDSNQDEFDIYQNNRNRRKIYKNNNIKIIQRGNERISPNRQGYRPEENSYYEEENIQNMKNININTRNNEDIEDDDNDEDDKMYDTNQLIVAKEGNYRIVQNNQINKRREEEFNRQEQLRNTGENEQIRDNEIEGEENEQIIQQTNINTNTDEDLYQRDEYPQDRDEPIQTENKNVKNIQTEINEKYYDNQGNYLGEKKIITTKQVPANSQIQREDFSPQKEEIEYQDNQEEQEDNQNENEYIPYQSNNKQFKKRGENKNIIESKYHSYFGDSNNNVYYEIKGVSGDINKEEESKNEEEVEKRNYIKPMIQVKNVNFGIQSENLCVPGQDNDNDDEDKHNIEDKENNDEKEADEQQIDENVEIEEEEEEEHNNINENKESNENLDKPEIEENIEKRDNFEEKIEENPENKENIEEIKENGDFKENYEENIEENQQNMENTGNLVNVEKSQNLEEKLKNVENEQNLNEEQNIKENENEYDNDINKMKNEENKIQNIEENSLNKNNENMYEDHEKENYEYNNNIDENAKYTNDINENVDNNNNIEEKNNFNENADYTNNNNIDGNLDINKVADKQESINIMEENVEINNNNDEMNLNNNNNEENNISNADENNIYLSNNENMNENNYDYNEEEQIIVENEAEEIENQNVQKEEGEENIDEGLVEMEENYEGNYEENEMVEGEEEGQEEYNDIENENLNKGEDENEQEN